MKNLKERLKTTKMVDYNLIYKTEFFDSITNYDNNFIDLIRNRISYLKKDPYKYSFISSYRLDLFTIKVTSKENDIKIIFKVIGKDVFVLFSYSLDLTHKQIRQIFIDLE